MKKVLVAAFYLLQGLVGLVYALFFVRVDVSLGGSGGVAVGLEFLFGGFLLVSSSLSLFAVLALMLRRWTYANTFGIVSSALFASFFGLIAIVVYNSYTVLGRDGVAFFWLLVSVGIVLLNLVATIFLDRVTRGG